MYKTVIIDVLGVNSSKTQERKYIPNCDSALEKNNTNEEICVLQHPAPRQNL